jgi:hypothetical protein
MARRDLAVAFLVALAVSLPAGTASATDLGVRAGLYSDADAAFLGVEALARVTPRVYFNPNFEWVFVDSGSYFTLNADFHYDFHMHKRRYAWLGAGLALVRTDAEGPGEGNTDAGLNILGGLGVQAGHVIPYVQLKVIAKDNAEFVIAAGLRF